MNSVNPLNPQFKVSTSNPASSSVMDVFKNFEEKLQHLNVTQIQDLIETVQTIVQNNHKRCLGMDGVHRMGQIEALQMKHQIENESHFLTREVLPKLHARLQ